MSKIQHLFKSKMPLAPKRKYGKLTLEQKIEIIRAAEMGLSQRALASRYNCGKTQVHLLVTQKTMWLDKWRKAGLKETTRQYLPPTPDQLKPFNEFNDLVFDFCAKMTSLDIPISGPMIQERAHQIARKYHWLDFTADKSWLETFIATYNIDLVESDGNGVQLLKCVSSGLEDKSFLQNYDVCDIFNLGEVRLAFKFVPSDSNTAKLLTTKDYLTISLCFNAVGSKEEEIIVFDSSQHGDVDLDLRSQLVPNWKGMMTQKLYEKRLTQLNADMASQNRHIVLLVDESKYTGSLECIMSNVKVKSTSSCLQSHPLLCGVGHMFKFLYCRRLLRMLLAHLGEGSVDELADKLTLNKAARLIQSAWDDVPPRTIQNCFLEAGLKHDGIGGEDINQVAESDEALILEIKNLLGLIHKQDTGEELSDDLFSPFIDDDICSNSTSDCSDIETDIFDEPTSQSRQLNSGGLTESRKMYPALVKDHSLSENNSDAHSLCSDSLPLISKLNHIATNFCSKDQLHKARMLLNDLEDLFEDIVADQKFSSNC